MPLRPRVLAFAILTCAALSTLAIAPAHAQFTDPNGTGGGSCREAGTEDGAARVTISRMPISLRLWQLAAQLVPQKAASSRLTAYGRPLRNFSRVRAAR